MASGSEKWDYVNATRQLEKTEAEKRGLTRKQYKESLKKVSIERPPGMLF